MSTRYGHGYLILSSSWLIEVLVVATILAEFVCAVHTLGFVLFIVSYRGLLHYFTFFHLVILKILMILFFNANQDSCYARC